MSRSASVTRGSFYVGSDVWPTFEPPKLDAETRELFERLFEDVDRAEIAKRARLTLESLDDSLDVPDLPDFLKHYLEDLERPLTIDAKRSTSDSGALTRDDIRLWWGLFAYAVVWLIVLRLLIAELGANESNGAIFTIALTMTGVTGHSVATASRKKALQLFDKCYPPDDKQE